MYKPSTTTASMSSRIRRKTSKNRLTTFAMLFGLCGCPVEPMPSSEVGGTGDESTDGRTSDTSADTSDSGETEEACDGWVTQSESLADSGLVAIADDVAQLHELIDGCQVRIERKQTAVDALYTVVIDDSLPAGSVEMSLGGLQRLASQDAFCGGVTTPIAPVLLDTDVAQSQGEFIEERVGEDQDASTLILGPHGGGIEPRTAEIAELLGSIWPSENPIVWVCRGWDTSGIGAFKRWHVTSDWIHEYSFPELELISHGVYERVVSIHGHGGLDGACGIDADVAVGGLAPSDLRADLVTALDSAFAGEYDVIDNTQGEACTGTNPNNIVNRYSMCGGVQLELSSDLRMDPVARQTLATTVANTLANWGGCPDDDDLVMITR